MNSRYLIVVAAMVSAAALVPVAAPVPAIAKTMKECAAEWDKMKAANQTGTMKYRDFTKQCMSGSAAPVGAAPTPTTAAPAPGAGAATTTAGKTGRQAMIARERACGAEWKADKAAGKIPAGQ